MYKILIRFYNNFKEYIILIFLLLISLSILPLNNKSNIRTIRTYALGNIAVLNSLVFKIQNLFSLQNQISVLEERNAELMLKVNQLREYGLENAELKAELKLKDSSNYPIIPSQIITKFIPGSEGYVIINVGENDSVKIGMPIVNENGFVGIITETIGEFSILKTLKSPDSRITVRDQRSGVDGILSWNGSDFIIQNVPTTDDVRVGDRIVTSPVSTIAPPSIPVGIVSNKQSSVAGLLTDITISPFVNFTKLKNVSVLQVITQKEINDVKLNLLRDTN